MISRFAILFVALIFARTAFGFETLNYDCSVWQLPDVKEELNKETNKRIMLALAGQNSCDPQKLFSSLKHKLAQPWADNLETWADQASIPKCKVPASKSVYQDFNIFDSPIGITAGLKGVINIGGVYVGTDKLSHFMTEGLQYFEALNSGSTLEDVLQQGWREENGIYGISMTGIRSYGDMSANYFGFTFWSSVLGGERPLIACENAKWKLERNFHWEDFVNDSFDESVNCNEYKSAKMQQAVDLRTMQLRKKAGRAELTCPLKPESCVELSRTLPTELRKFLISPRCRN